MGRRSSTTSAGRLWALGAAGALLGGCGLGGPSEEGSASGDPAPEPAPSTVTASPAPEPTPGVALESMGVSAGHPAAVQAGMAVLDSGGNAVDAAIAAAFAVSVVEPFASGIGGGGAALVVPTDEEEPARAYDYREVVADDGVIPASGVGVPGFVAGMATLHEEHGVLEWPELLGPAITLAGEGHPVSEMLAVVLRMQRGQAIAAGQSHFGSGGQPLAAGDLLVQAELARTLQTLAADGADALYTGALSEALTSTNGIDASSLAGYEVRATEPVRGPVGGLELMVAAPPLPGATLIQMIQVAEALDVAEQEPGSAAFVDSMSRAWGVAEASVQTELGDPDFVDVPVAELTDPARNEEIAAELPAPASGNASEARGEPVAFLGPQQGSAEAMAANTTHISVVDGDGLAVSMTNTITTFWGSAQYVDGYFLNDQLTRFAAIGQTSANEPSPGRRSVSWSLPAVLADGEGRPVLVLGTPGGPQIPSVLAGVLTRYLHHGLSLSEAVDAGRMQPQAGVLRVEAMPPADVEAELRAMGYGFEVVSPQIYLFGSVQALEVDHESGQVSGHADSRREGAYGVAPAADDATP